MLRPTPKEAIAGIQRTITETLMPELKSPFAISQAATATMVLSAATEWIESFPKHNAAEIDDLKQTFDSLRPHGESAILEAAGFREAIEGGVRASDEEPPDWNGMETAMGALAGGVATGRIAGAVAAEVRGYLKRHLERIRALFGNNSPFA
jgi:hypothetical protein